jgi:DNA-binding NarL/FixJ family response regulator
MSARPTLVAVTQPDVAVVDIHMPSDGDSGRRAAGEIRVRHSHVGVLVLLRLGASYAFELLGERSGLGTCIRDRRDNLAERADAVRRVGLGRIRPRPGRPPSARRPAPRRPREGPDALHDLSERERELFKSRRPD